MDTDRVEKCLDFLDLLLALSQHSPSGRQAMARAMREDPQGYAAYVKESQRRDAEAWLAAREGQMQERGADE